MKNIFNSKGQSTPHIDLIVFLSTLLIVIILIIKHFIFK